MTIQTNFPAINPSLNLNFAKTKILDSRITFTRSTTATYYDGVTTAKAEENLHIKSQEFDDSAWQKTGVSVTADSTTAPDGTSTAELIAETATSATHQISGNVTNNRPSVISGQIYAFSVFLKKGTGATAPDIFQVSWGGAAFSTNAYVNFNLSTGTVSASGADASNATITSVGSSWYRCSFTATATSSAASSIGLFFVENNGSATRAPSYTGVTTADVFVWGAQLEQRSAVTAYTATTTQPITNYIPVLRTAAAGVARFDHNPTTRESLGFLIEEQRTNLLLQSQDFATTWSWTRGSTTANTSVAPDGTLTGDKLVPNTDNNSHRVVQTVTTSAGTWTFSAYLKKGEYSGAEFRIADGTSTVTNSGTKTTVDLLTESLSSTSFYGPNATAGSASIVDAGNDWYRVSVTVTVTSSAGSLQGQIFVQSVAGTTTYAGDGYSGIFIWGAQLEVGAFPTSYIATTSATVTRNADVASMTGTNFTSWFNQGQGSLYVDSVVLAITNQRIASFNDGTANNRIIMSRGTGSGGNINATVTVGGSAQVSALTFGSSLPATTTTKAAFAYKQDDFAGSVNGGAAVTGTSGTIPTVNILALGSGEVLGANVLNGYLRRVTYYPIRLSNAQLQALTS